LAFLNARPARTHRRCKKKKRKLPADKKRATAMPTLREREVLDPSDLRISNRSRIEATKRTAVASKMCRMARFMRSMAMRKVCPAMSRRDM
jgi:hypothetical protein